LNRNEAPFKNKWVLPGAFVQMEETFSETCTRVLSTKLGIRNIFLEQLYSFDALSRDPRGRTISVSHYALINPNKFQLAAGKMANDVQWFSIKKVPHLGFDHTEIMKMAKERLQSKILYYPTGFSLLDEVFTMTELHQLYECILDTEIDRRNFTRKILESGFVTATGQKREGLKNRPAELYKFNKILKQNNFHLNIK
jgi:8-oxo-dGTP diphosphatase